MSRHPVPRGGEEANSITSGYRVPLSVGSPLTATVVVVSYLKDLVCPFSRNTFRTLAIGGTHRSPREKADGCGREKVIGRVKYASKNRHNTSGLLNWQTARRELYLIYFFKRLNLHLVFLFLPQSVTVGWE